MIQASVVHLCVSEAKGTPKQPIDRVRVGAGHGIEGDAHAGPGHRQISLLDTAEVDAFRPFDAELPAGIFGENIGARGLKLAAMGIGTHLQLGNVELEITQVGKVCHHRCTIYERIGDCVMPRAGVFTRVLHGGEITIGAPITITQEVPRSTIQAAVLTVSDRCAAGVADDQTGPRICFEVRDQLDAHVAWVGIVPDEKEQISNALRDLRLRGLDLVLTCGSTGCGPRDVTPKATAVVLEREVPGVAEAMRSASLQVTPHAMLQRGRCGISGGTLILNLPGSPKAASKNLKAVIVAIPHTVQLLRGQTSHVPAE